MTYPGAQATYRLADALFLIGHDEFTGKPHVAVDRLECGLAGAALAELMFEGRIALDGGGSPLSIRGCGRSRSPTC